MYNMLMTHQMMMTQQGCSGKRPWQAAALP
jgi:hypothetical protein